jgi:signal recognition particle GTPase
MQTKSDKLAALLKAEDYNAALALAEKFPRLGDAKDAIRTAHAARINPRFYMSMGKDPAQLVQNGINALKQRYEYLTKEQKK